jgi:hypothetical protein
LIIDEVLNVIAFHENAGQSQNSSLGCYSLRLLAVAAAGGIPSALLVSAFAAAGTRRLRSLALIFVEATLPL